MAQFINCKKNVEIVEGENKVLLSAGYIGQIPPWVEEHWYFKALCKDGTITAVVKTEDNAAELASEAALKKDAAEKAAAKKRLIDEAKAAAKEAAEKEAAETGLNVADTKKLIAKMEKTAAGAANALLAEDS